MTRKKRVALSDSQRQSVYRMHLSGEKAEDIAAAYDISMATVYRVLKQEREKGSGDMAQREMTIAGNRKNGRLVSTGNSRFYVGTCMVGGKMRSHDFEAANAREAKELWSQWCIETRESEKSFMEACAPRDAETAEVETVPFDDVECEETVYGGLTADEVAEDAEVVEPRGDVAYVVLCKVPEPRMYGLYADMDGALAEVERMNEVSRFMGNGSAFEVDEVPWKCVG